MDNRINKQIIRKVQHSKIEQGKKRKYEQTNHKHWNWNCDQKLKGGFTGIFCQIYREQWTPIFLKIYLRSANKHSEAQCRRPSSSCYQNQTKIPSKKRTTGQ